MINDNILTVPGKYLKLHHLPIGTTIYYPLSLSDLNKEYGEYLTDYYATVYNFKDTKTDKIKKLLSLTKPLIFRYIVQPDKDNNLYGLKTVDIRIDPPAPNDGSTVMLARLITGSGISQSLAPAGAIHDIQTREAILNNMKIKLYYDEFDKEGFVIKTDFNQLARFWGSAVKNQSNKRIWFSIAMQKFLQFIHPRLATMWHVPDYIHHK